MGLKTKKKSTKQRRGTRLKQGTRKQGYPFRVPAMPKYILHQTYPEHIENIITEGLRSSANTGKGIYKYDNVKILSKPKEKKKSNIILFDKIFTSLAFNPEMMFKYARVINQEWIIILDVELLKEQCNKNTAQDSCYLSDDWYGGKKRENNYITYDPALSLKENLGKWRNFLYKSHYGIIQNELLLKNRIDPKYIKAVLLLPPKYPGLYLENDSLNNFKVIKHLIPLKEKIDYTNVYIYNIFVFDYLKNKYPHIKFIRDFKELD